MGCKSRLHADIVDIHNEVTGSCHLCVITKPDREKLTFLVDFGLFQREGKKDDEQDADNILVDHVDDETEKELADREKEEVTKLNQNLDFNPSNVDFCIITHNHIDHTGRLPLLTKKGFNGKIYATETTCKLLPEALNDSYSVLKGRAKNAGISPLYEEGDVAYAVSLCTPCEYEETIHVNDYVKMNFFPNNHLPGAAIILVRISYPECEDINLLFTGDYNSKNVFLKESSLPEWVLDLPITIIQESTYGDTDSEEIESCFDTNILNAVEQEWTVLIPVFSLGRAQEILYRLKGLQTTGLLDVNIPIYLDGKLAIRYTNMYQRGFVEFKDNMYDFLPENFSFVDKILRNTLLNEDDSCKIILTSSGMGSYGPARTYIPAYLGRKKMLIHFTGYTAVGTLGRKLKDAADGADIQVAGIHVTKRAQVEYTSEFSSHAKADTMIEFLKQFSNLKLVLVNHGDADVKEIFAERISKEINAKEVHILNRENDFRIGPWGLIKTIPTKFI